jgi:hypothetical protein
MTLAQEFRRFAGECREFARTAPNRESKATWNDLAERWDRCAVLEETRGAPTHVDGHRRDRTSGFRFRVERRSAMRGA